RIGRDAGNADEDFALGGEPTVGPTTEPVEARLAVAAVVGARHQVEPTIAVDVRQLRTEVRPASPGRDPLVVAEVPEGDGRRQAWMARAAHVAVDLQEPVVGAQEEIR